MQNVIKQILSIVGDNENSKFTIDFYPPDEIFFHIYDAEIAVGINKKEKYAYVDTEFINNHLTSNMLLELSEIVKIIEENIDIILGCFSESKIESEK